MDYQELFTECEHLKSRLQTNDNCVFASPICWPIRVTEQVEVLILNEASNSLLELIKYGYDTEPDLWERIGASFFNKNNFQTEVDNLIKGKTLMRSNGRLVVLDGQVSSTRTVAFYDAFTDTQIEDLENASDLVIEQCIPNVPVANDLYLNLPGDNLRFLPCCILRETMKDRTGEVGRVFVYSGNKRLSSLEELIYDLILDKSPRLEQTGLLPARLPDDSENIDCSPLENGDSSLPDKEYRTASITSKSTPDIHVSKTIAKTSLTHSTRKSASFGNVTIVRGIDAHLRVLDEALHSATQSVVLITPFVRARLLDHNLLRSFSQCLNRHIYLSILYGLPPQAGDFDDSTNEQRRIEQLRNRLRGFCTEQCLSQLQFVRLHAYPEWVSGNHSKILICDKQWAVVTSFNWLSKQTTEETGLRVGKETAAELLKPYQHLLNHTKDIPTGNTLTQANISSKSSQRRILQQVRTRKSCCTNGNADEQETAPIPGDNEWGEYRMLRYKLTCRTCGYSWEDTRRKDIL